MTPERIQRHDDERLYQPGIHSRRIRELYRISEETGEAITVLVDRALREFIRRRSPDQAEAWSDDEEQDDLPSTSEDRSRFQSPPLRL
jgi:hypothetical protein